MAELTIEERNECWVLLIISFYSKTGITAEEIFQKDKRKLNLIYNQIFEILSKLKKEDLIESKHQQIQTIYFITPKGKTKLKKDLNKLRDADFMDFIDLAPPEIILNYRVHNLENTVVFGVLGAALFQFSLWLIKFQQWIIAFIVLILSLLSIGYSIGCFSNTLAVVFYRTFKSTEEKLKKWKKISNYLKYLESLSQLLEKIRSKLPYIIFIIILIPALIIVNCLFYKQFPQDWKIFFYGETIIYIIGGILWAAKKSFEKPLDEVKQIENNLKG